MAHAFSTISASSELARTQSWSTGSSRSARRLISVRTASGSLSGSKAAAVARAAGGQVKCIGGTRRAW